MPDPTRWTIDQMRRLAARGVLKVDLLGHRGTTLVTCEEVAAMAGIIVAAGALPPGLLKPENIKRETE